MPTKQLPGPPLPAGGSWAEARTNFIQDPAGYLMNMYNNYGDLCGLVEGASSFIFAFGPAYNRQVLSNPECFYSQGRMVKGPPDSALQRLNAGLLGMNGDLHKQHRRLVMPAFHKQQVRQFVETVATLTTAMLDEWQVGDALDIAAAMRKLTLRIASQVMLGISDAQADRVSGLIEQWMEMNSAVPITALDGSSPAMEKLLAISTALEHELRAVIQSKQHNLSERDLLSLLINAYHEDGSGMGEDELIGQSNVLFAAGYTTTTNALTWTLFLLAQHPSVMARLFAEFESQLTDDLPTLEQLHQLPYLNAVIQESLRLLPPILYTARFATQPFLMGSYDFPRRTVLILSHLISHRLPQYFPEPARFCPERWQNVDLPPYAYIPFSFGPRLCIGRELSLMEIKLILPLLYRRFKLELQPYTNVSRAVKLTSLTPQDGLMMIARPQDKRFQTTVAPVGGNIHELVQLN